MLSSEVCSRAQIVVGSTWDGQPIPRDQYCVVEYSVVENPVVENPVVENSPAPLDTAMTQVQLTWDAPHDGLTPAPAEPPGFLPELWRFEVVEVFIAGTNGVYLEFEVGPWGHFAAFAFSGRRRKEGDLRVQHYACERVRGRFRGCLRLDAAALPPGPLRWNAHRIDGGPLARRYFSASASSGMRPDFHDFSAAVALTPS